MQPAKPRRPQLRTLTCPNCAERGLLRPILWGMPEEGFNYDRFSSGGCVLPSPTPPDCRCGGCFHAIPPQKQSEIKLRKKIMVCENCGRILADADLADAVEVK